MTYDEYKAMLRELDPDDLVDLLQVDSDTLVDTLEDIVHKRWLEEECGDV